MSIISIPTYIYLSINSNHTSLLWITFNHTLFTISLYLQNNHKNDRKYRFPSCQRFCKINISTNLIIVGGMGNI